MMQLQFTFDQLRLLFSILEQDCRQLRDKISRVNDIDVKLLLTNEEVAEEDLLEKIITRHLQFSSDELDELAEVLRKHGQQLRAAISATLEEAAKQDLRTKLGALERVLDKVVEACAMV
jgi:hypothetical protein